MGLAKRQMELEDERGFSAISGCVCGECFDENYIRGYIADNAKAHECDFCGRRSDVPIAADADDVAELVMAGVRSEWDDPGHELYYDGQEGGYQGETHDLIDILETVGSPISGEEFLESFLSSAHSALWSKRDYGALFLDELMQFDWRRFVDEVKYASRFFFAREVRKGESLEPGQAENATQLLTRIMKSAEEVGLFVELPSGAALWRAQERDRAESLTSAARLGTAPAERAGQGNRMSPPGIPAFYGSEDLETAVGEIAPTATKECWSAGHFELSEACTVLDLTALPEAPSLFDSERRHLRRPVWFLEIFATELSRASTAGVEQIDYVPTQVVSEFVRLIFKPSSRAPANGLRYPSARGASGINVALFVDNEHCIDAGRQAHELSLVLRETNDSSF